MRADVTFVITGLVIMILAVAVRKRLPPHSRAQDSFAVVLLAWVGVALLLASLRLDTPMVSWR